MHRLRLIFSKFKTFLPGLKNFFSGRHSVSSFIFFSLKTPHIPLNTNYGINLNGQFCVITIIINIADLIVSDAVLGVIPLNVLRVYDRKDWDWRGHMSCLLLFKQWQGGWEWKNQIICFGFLAPESCLCFFSLNTENI